MHPNIQKLISKIPGKHIQRLSQIHAFCKSVKLCLYMCLLSLFSLEKHTSAGISIVVNVKMIQKARIYVGGQRYPTVW